MSSDRIIRNLQTQFQIFHCLKGYRVYFIERYEKQPPKKLIGGRVQRSNRTGKEMIFIF